MQMTPYIVTIVICAVGTLLLALAGRRALRGLVPTAFSGLVGLWAVGSGAVLGLAPVTANLFTVTVALFLGLPGVAGLVLLRAISLL